MEIIVAIIGIVVDFIVGFFAGYKFCSIKKGKIKQIAKSKGDYAIQNQNGSINAEK